MLAGACPIEGSHHGRLSVEQIYGYMVRNHRRYGILTTVNSWVFLMRENFGKLYMTQPFDCRTASPPFTILQALYYITALSANSGGLIRDDLQGNQVSIPLADSKYPRTAPSALGFSSQTYYGLPPPGAVAFIHPLPPGNQYRLVAHDFKHGVVLEPYLSEKCCAGKSFHAKLMPGHQPVCVEYVFGDYGISFSSMELI